MKGEDILAIDKFYAVIPAYEPDEKMLAVIDDISSLTDFHIIAAARISCRFLPKPQKKP